MRKDKAMRQDVIRHGGLNFMATDTEAMVGFDSSEEIMMAPPYDVNQTYLSHPLRGIRI